MTNFEKVKEFMTTFGQEVKNNAEFPNDKIVELRKKLIDEEFNELKDAITDNDIVEVADALTDILVVTYGAGAAFGGVVAFFTVPFMSSGLPYLFCN